MEFNSQGHVDFVQRWVNSLPSCDDDSGSLHLDSINILSSQSSIDQELCSLTSQQGSKQDADPTQKVVNCQKEQANRFTFEEKCETPARSHRRQLWKNSNYSSFTSESSIEQLLDERKVNPEAVLMNLGFGSADDSIVDRLPARFLISQTQAHGIDLENFIRGHPEFGRYFGMDSDITLAELYSRLPLYYHQEDPSQAHTSLHRQFTLQAQDHVQTQSIVPMTVHKAEDGTMFHSILSRSNTEVLAKQGFYSEHSSISLRPDSASSLSTHDCTIESSDIPSPIILNNSLSDEKREAFIHQSSVGSDSVFSSADDPKTDQYLLSRLESIQEKSLQEMNDNDLEEGMGITFINRRYSAGDLLQRQQSSSDDSSEPITNTAEKRKLFTRMKSVSFDEDALSKMLHEQLGNPKISRQNTTPAVVVHTEDADNDLPENERVIPKQMEGLLQVVAIDSFDSIDSDSCTVVPSPNEGLSPVNSRAGSLSIIPALESFDLEEIQSVYTPSANELTVPLPTSKRRRPKLQRSVSDVSDSDSSGIADVDSKSQTGQPDSLLSSTDIDAHSKLSPTNCSHGSLFSDPSTYCGDNSKYSGANVYCNSHASTLPQCGSSSSSSELYYASALSTPLESPSTDLQTFQDISAKVSLDTKALTLTDACVQTDELICPNCSCDYNLTTTSLSCDKNDSISPSSPAKSISCQDSTSTEHTTSCDKQLCSNAIAVKRSKIKFYVPSSLESDEPESEHEDFNTESTQTQNLDNSSSNVNQREINPDEQEASKPLPSMPLSPDPLQTQENPGNLGPTSVAATSPRDVIIKLEELSELVRHYQLHCTEHQTKEWTGISAMLQFQEDVTKLTKTLKHDLPCLERTTSEVSGPESSLPEAVDSPPWFSPSAQFEPIKDNVFVPIKNTQLLKVEPSHKVQDKAPRTNTDNGMCIPTPRDEHYGGTDVHASSVVRDILSSGGRRPLAGSVNSSPASQSSAPPSVNTGSVSSTFSRLSDHLSLSESKRKYEKKIAELEMQKYQISLQMKDDEIQFWKNIAEQMDY